MQMKLKLTVAAAVAAVAGLAFAQDVQVVKIGHVAPMSGSQAHYGKDNPKNGSYPTNASRSGGSHGGRGRVIFPTT